MKINFTANVNFDLEVSEHELRLIAEETRKYNEHCRNNNRSIGNYTNRNTNNRQVIDVPSKQPQPQNISDIEKQYRDRDDEAKRLRKELENARKKFADEKRKLRNALKEIDRLTESLKCGDIDALGDISIR